jgi:malate dehydrogenase (oxaloacetate-decarboxylating)
MTIAELQPINSLCANLHSTHGRRESVADDLGKKSVELHRQKRGKLEVRPKVQVGDSLGLSLAYTPGVAQVCREIAANPDLVYELNIKWNSVAVVSDGTRVLGLGNIGPLAAIPVMEGKAALFKAYANIDALPICLATQDLDKIVETVKNIAPVFGGINLEDIASPKCFEVEDRLRRELDIPVFHDDQHGTAVVVLAGLLNALKVVGKKKQDAKIVVAGAGAAGVAITKLLLEVGFSDIIVCDSKGILQESEEHHASKQELVRLTNKSKMTGTLEDAIKGADALIGASSPNILQPHQICSMNSTPIVFALSNPIPEVEPKKTLETCARIVGTARADLPNQINNVLGFPGIFRGALLVRSKQINERMKLAAAYALAGVVSESELSASYVVPAAFDRRVVPAVATAVANAAMASGVARLKLTPDEIGKELALLGLA